MIEGHTVDMPVSNPFLTDKLIDEELKQMMDMQVSEKRRGYKKKQCLGQAIDGIGLELQAVDRHACALVKQMMDMQVSEKRRGSVLDNIYLALSVIAISRTDLGIDIQADDKNACAIVYSRHASLREKTRVVLNNLSMTTIPRPSNGWHRIRASGS